MNASSDGEIDLQLVKRVQGGDKQAFSLLVAKYQRKMARIVARMLKNPDDVQDVIQESFIKAYRAINKFRGDSAFYTWIYRIAINEAKNHLVMSGRRPSASTSSELNDENSETFQQIDNLTDISTPESVLLSRQIVDTVNEVINQLPEELKTTLMLREIEGMSYADISDLMDCPIGTVRSRIFRARDAVALRLKPLLGDQGNKRW